MADEENLRSDQFGGAAMAAVSAVSMNLAARRGPKWLKWLMLGFTAIVVLATVAGLVEKIGNIGQLPTCDAQRTRDTLSDLNSTNKLNASKYNFIKTISTDDAEVRCTANLALRDGATVEYDYRIYKDAGTLKVQITEWRRP